MNSFMSWVGGKKSLRDAVLARFPPYYERYIEVFGGAGWVLFHKPPGNDFECYNDFNSNLVNLYRCVRDNPNRLKYKLRYVLDSREDFEWIASLHKRGLFPRFRDYDRAAKFYQLVRYSYASGLDSFASQPHSIWSDFPLIDMAARRLQKVIVENKDFEKLIRQYDRPVSFFYCDPPYFATETKAPYGYVQNAVSETVELTYAGQEIEVRDTVNQAFVNDYQEVDITLSKFMEHDELFALGENEEYRYVRFGLFADEIITAADGTTIPENGMIAEVSLTEDMTAKFDAQLPFGRYYVQEIATDEHYMLNGEKYLVNFEYMGQEVTTVSFDCGTFENHLKRGNANGYKVNEDDEPLANALFGLFTTDTTAFTANTAIKTAISDETGYFEFTEIPYGEYVICEIQAPDGYILSDKQYPVTINEDGDTVEITAENEAITVEISKQDIYGSELAGAEMQLIDSEGNVVDEWVSDGTNHVISEHMIHSHCAPNFKYGTKSSTH